MKRYSLLGLLVAFGLTLGLARVLAAPASNTVALNADADAQVHSGTPATNYGAGSLGVTPDNQSYVWFDLSGIPSGGTILSATLRLMPADIIGQGPWTVSVARVNDPWNEATVTWNTKPAVSSPGPSTAVGDYIWQSWDVTALVQQWYGGSMSNYGFGLVTTAPGVYFHSKETGPAPQLLITYTVGDDPDGSIDPSNPYSDFGDAPDSSNHHGITNTAYAGTPGRFPTVWNGTAAGQPAGPKHVNQTAEAFLGDNISREQGADGGSDADGVNNILRNPGGAVVDTANNDRADDGWRNRHTLIVDCQRTSLVVRVHKAPGAQRQKMYLNVWFDGNRDGDWEDVAVCQFSKDEFAPGFEWIVQNYAVNLGAIPAGGSSDLTIPTLPVHNAAPKGTHWMRFTLSEKKAPLNASTGLADGRGPHPNDTPDAYDFGETEDVLYQPDPEGQSGVLTLTKTVQTDTTPVGYGAIVSYTIRLKNDGGSQPAQMELRDSVAWPQRIAGPITVKALSPGVSPLAARLEQRLNRTPKPQAEQMVRWRGILNPGAELGISFPVRVHPICGSGQSTVTITNTVTLHKPDGTKVDQDAVAFQAACPSYKLGDIQVNQELRTDKGSGVGALSAPSAAGRRFQTLSNVMRLAMDTSFTNNTQESVTLGWALNFEETGYVEVSAAAANGTKTTCDLVTLGPGETRSFDKLIDLRKILGSTVDQIPDDPAQDIELRSRMRYVLAPPGEPFECSVIDALDPDQVGQNDLQIKMRPWDVGDAPDSTNHAATAMDAYPGVPNAQFPTVFDVATGAPEGPAHARPRPFHLGKRVETEADADLLPAPRNIDPATNTPNRDRYDDGAQPGTWSFDDCRPTTVSVQVFISPAAVAWFNTHGGQGYLNAWLDANRDGDWADYVQCPDDPPLPAVAPEHIVIDAPVDVATLGPGLHTISVTTGRVPWPSALVDKPAWVRVTLSERASNKTLNAGTIAYGDGRGHSTPFATGETEDYLWRPKGQGVDLAIRGQVRWDPLVVNPGVGASSVLTAQNAYKFTLKLAYSNEGTEPAVGATIAMTLPPQLTDTNLINVVSMPPNKSIKIIRRITLEPLGPGQGGTVMASWQVDEAGAMAMMAANLSFFDITFNIYNSGTDADPSNNGGRITTWRNLLLPTVGFAPAGGTGLLSEQGSSTCPPRCHVPRGTTSRNTVDILGQAEPDSTLRVRVVPHGLGGRQPYSLTVPVDASGAWSQQLTGLSNSLYWVSAEYIPTASRQSRIQTYSGSGSYDLCLVVDMNQAVDMLPLAFTDSQGRVFSPDTLGGKSGSIHWPSLEPGETYDISVGATNPADPPAESYWCLQANQQCVSLWDNDGDGVFTGRFTAPASTGAMAAQSVTATGDASLTVVTADGSEESYGGTIELAAPGVVSSLSAGQPISGASVSLLEQVPVSSTTPSAVVYNLWDGASAGQPNPVTTGSDGTYRFAPPAGTYRLYVTRDGYQPYRSEDLNIAAGEAITQAIALSPSVSDTADVMVEIGDGGFSPGVLTVPPGTTIRWVNAGVEAHSATADAAAQAAGNGFDSGLLTAGESYTFTVTSAVTVTYADVGDAFNTGTLIVDPNAPPVGGYSIFLPVVQK